MPGQARGSAVGDALSVVRYHIVLVAMAACAVFGWLFTGRMHLEVALLVGIDWFVINLANRLTDIDEDLANDIRGTARVARNKRAVAVLCAVAIIGSFAWTAVAFSGLLVWRALVQAIGVAYNFRVLPAPGGRTRLKELYLFKNTGSSAIFVLTCFVYPLSIAPPIVGWSMIFILGSFFVLFELTYEILYDLRDLEGDRAEGIPTFPVVHGARRARQIIDVLLVVSGGLLVAGFALKQIGVREALMIAAPLIQFALYRPLLATGLESRDCILITHVGTMLLLVYAAGNHIWLSAGLPANVFL